MGDAVTSEYDHVGDVTDAEEPNGNVGPNKNWTVNQTRTFLAI